MARSSSAQTLVERLLEIEGQLSGAARLPRCRRLLVEGLAALQENGSIAGTEAVRLFTLALQDAALMVEAYDGLMKPEPLRRARRRLREAFDGGSVFVPAQVGDSPRDKLWELTLAAKFRGAALRPEFGDDVCPPKVLRPDLFVYPGNARLAVEAKRVRSVNEDALSAHVSKAVEQIVSACAQQKADCGFIALDLSFAADQHAQQGLWRVAREDAPDGVREQLAPHHKRLQLAVLKTVQAQPGAHLVVGAIVLFMPAMVYQDTRKAGLIRYFSTFAFPERDAALERPFLDVAARCFADDGN